MNKGLLSFLVLFFITLIMGAMTYFINLNYEEAKLKAESVKNQKNEILNINEEENGQKAIENNKKELKEDREKENISENNNKQSNDLDKSQLKEEKEIEIEGKSKENATNIKKNEKSKEKVAEEKSSKESKEVFKVDKYSIPKKINKADKFKLNECPEERKFFRDRKGYESVSKNFVDNGKVMISYNLLGEIEMLLGMITKVYGRRLSNNIAKKLGYNSTL